MADDSQPIKGSTGWYRFTHSLAKVMPQRLTRSRNARRRLRSLKGAGR